ncbi:MAG TPA: glycosyltransferase [Planctomycetaceae bacterium]|nr:glycosyltransferase [Planctomycetaceae bacterium]
MKATGPHDALRRDRKDVRPATTVEISPPPSPHFTLPGSIPAGQERGLVRRFPASDHELTVVVPAYNEEQRLPATLDGLADYLDRWGVDYRVVVVDDGSRDRTARLTDGRGFRFKTISQENRGKGAAVRNGMLQATGQVVAFTDADLPYDLDGVRTAYQSIRAGECSIVFGARDLRDSAVLAPRRLARTFATHVFRALMRVLVSRQITDTQCGLKVFSRRAALEVFTRTRIDGFAFDAEVVYLTHQLRLPYARMPVTLINEYASTISLSRHALPMLLDVVRVRRRSWHGEYGLDGVAPIVIDSQSVEPVQAAA